MMKRDNDGPTDSDETTMIQQFLVMSSLFDSQAICNKTTDWLTVNKYQLILGQYLNVE